MRQWGDNPKISPEEVGRNQKKKSELIDDLHLIIPLPRRARRFVNPQDRPSRRGNVAAEIGPIPARQTVPINDSIPVAWLAVPGKPHAAGGIRDERRDS